MCKKLAMLMSCALVLCICTSQVQADITDGLVGRWLLSDGSGTVAVDASGEGNDGTIEGDPIWVSDPVRGGTVMVLDGVDDRIIFGPLYTLQNNSWSFSLWVKTPPNDDRIPLIGKNDASGGFNAGEFDIEITGDGTWGNIIDPEPAGNLAVNAHSQGGAVTDQAAISLDDDTWHFVTVVHDEAGGDTDIAFYIDGVAHPSGSQTFNNNGQADVGDMYLGFANASGSGAEGYFAGRMSDLRLYNRAVTAEEVAEIMTVSLMQEIAGDAVPEDGGIDVIRDVTLSWKAGKYAQTHNVYLGSSYAEVNEAGVGEAVSVNQTDTFYEAGILEFGQTYYWRVDEVNGTPDKTVFKGDVWSFEVEPYSIRIPGDTIAVTASTVSNSFSTADKVIDGSGLDPNAPDVHNMDSGSMWYTASVDLDPWIQFEFDGVKKLDAMKVWNANSAAESAIGWGIKDVITEVSVDGVTWTTVADANQFSRAPGSVGYDQPDLIDLGGATAKYLRLDIQSNWGGLIMSYGLSEIQFLEIPVNARTPDPADGATDVLPNAVITWRAGREAVLHHVYVGTDMTAVLEGSVQALSTSENSLSLNRAGGELGQTYYWRVDEVNDAEVPSVWSGPVWSLDTADVLVVDDFDGYNNSSPDRPFQTWLDGIGYSADDFFPVPYGGNGTGSAIGHDIWSLSSPYYDGEIMEELITMAGSDLSMPFYYDNSATATSETTANIADLQVGQDWSQNGIKYLTLHFRSDSLSQALDTTSTITAGDTVGWLSQDEVSQDGVDAAQSRAIGNNTNASMHTTVTGPGTVSFYWKVSSEVDWDFLQFYIDGVEQDGISGEVDWEQKTYQITGAGAHTLEWRYAKDQAVFGGQDAGWVDQFEWTGGGQPSTMPGNTGQLYAKINGVRVDYSGSVAEVQWSAWKIDLGSLGTNLQNVQTVTVGIDGAGASGLLYFDNFQLEPGE